MKYKVWNETSKESVVTLRLINSQDSVKLVAVGATGNTLAGGYLLTIHGGRIYLNSSVSHALGFDLDGMGSLQVDHKRV